MEVITVEGHVITDYMFCCTVYVMCKQHSSIGGLYTTRMFLFNIFTNPFQCQHEMTWNEFSAEVDIII